MNSWWYLRAFLACLLASVTIANELIDRCPPELPRGKYLLAAEWETCYEFHLEERTWRGANYVCQEKGGHLVTIKEARIQSFIMRALVNFRWPRNGLWIGATDKDQEMDWRWITGERVKDGFSKWARGQPGCGIFCFEDCAVMRYDEGGRWHDYRCNWITDYSFICQYDMVPETTPTTTTTTTTTTTSTTTKTTTTTTTTPSTTTTEETTKEQLEAKYLLHDGSVGHTDPANVSEMLVIHGLYSSINGARAEQVQETSSSSSGSMSTGTLAAIIAAVVSALVVGVCCLFLLVRRRRKKETEDEFVASYENPYYGQANTPLKAAGDKDDEMAVAAGGDDVDVDGVVAVVPAKSIKSNVPLPASPGPAPRRAQRVMNTYDRPPCLATHRPVVQLTKGTGQPTKGDYHTIPTAASPVEENYYDEVGQQRSGSQVAYDVPRSGLPSIPQDDVAGSTENMYYNNGEENLYESVDNLRAMLQQHQQNEATEEGQKEEDRYVPFVLDSTN